MTLTYRKIKSFFAQAFLVCLFTATTACSGPPPLIAHAGGGINGKSYTNSLEALELNYAKGHRLFECDFEWTSDGHLVLMHDWNKGFEALFGDPKPVPSLEGFLRLKMSGGLTQLSLRGLIEWLDGHRDARIVTDVKRKNIEALTSIRDRYPEQLGRFIPQIYSFSEYRIVRGLGYEDIILTLYRTSATNDEVVRFSGNNELYAVTMPAPRAFSGLPGRLKAAGVFAYAHTVNNPGLRDRLFAAGVGGLYTDFMVPPASEREEVAGEK
ncbi:MAG: glycerophosphodiester phosphodiesterase family protein [Thermodesulfobacteriota bacterium]